MSTADGIGRRTRSGRGTIAREPARPSAIRSAAAPSRSRPSAQPWTVRERPRSARSGEGSRARGSSCSSPAGLAARSCAVRDTSLRAEARRRRERGHEDVGQAAERAGAARRSARSPPLRPRAMYNASVGPVIRYLNLRLEKWTPCSTGSAPRGRPALVGRADGACLDRIAERDGEINAWVRVHRRSRSRRRVRPTTARARRRAVPAACRSGSDLMPSRAADRVSAVLDEIPRATATSERLAAQGMVLLGHLHTLSPPAGRPIRLRIRARPLGGGSSGGSPAALAAGMTPAATGNRHRGPSHPRHSRGRRP